MRPAVHEDIGVFAQIAALLDMECRHRDHISHAHKCNACGHVWSHVRAHIAPSDNRAAHTCPCGQEQYKIFRGDA